MILAGIIQFGVTIALMVWLLKRKPGEKFSKKTVAKCILLGCLGTALTYILSIVVSLDENTFYGMNPILSGFLTALITAAILEEVSKYILFRLALLKNNEVVTWLDAMIAAILVGAGFTLLEDVVYLAFGAPSILRALLPMHLLFQGAMGYYYGKARVTKQFKYHVLSLVVPILCHTLFDMFLIGIKSIVGDIKDVKNLTDEELMSLPYANYFIPLLVCAVIVFIVMFIALVMMFKKIGVWSKNGEKQELLDGTSEVAENI